MGERERAERGRNGARKADSEVFEEDDAKKGDNDDSYETYYTNNYTCKLRNIVEEMYLH